MIRRNRPEFAPLIAINDRIVRKAAKKHGISVTTANRLFMAPIGSIKAYVACQEPEILAKYIVERKPLQDRSNLIIPELGRMIPKASYVWARLYRKITGQGRQKSWYYLKDHGFLNAEHGLREWHAQGGGYELPKGPKSDSL